MKGTSEAYKGLSLISRGIVLCHAIKALIIDTINRAEISEINSTLNLVEGKDIID